MRLPKQLLPWLTLLIASLLFIWSFKPDRLVQANHLFQAENSFKVFLPIVMSPGHTYLPFISNEPPAPTWSGGSWMGPNGVSAVTVDGDPNNPNIFYTGTGGAGVFKSTDGGQSWSWASTGLGNLTLDSFAVDPTDTNILYAGTHGGGVYRSNNAGQSWFPVNNGIISGAVVYSLAVNPGNHNLLYAGTRDQGTFTDGTEHYAGRLYKSTDGGSSWHNTLSTSDDWVYSIAADADNPSTVLAAVHIAGPFISYDYGETWHEASISGVDCDKGRVIAFDPRSYLQRAYYATWHGGFFISTNNGASWVESSSGLGSSHVFPNGIAINPDYPDTIYLAIHSEGPAGVMKSTNAGSSWNGAGLSNDIVYSVAVSSNALIAGTYLDGVYRSTDGGSSWASTQYGILNAQVTGLALPQSQVILASTLSQGVQQSKDGGETWSAFNDNLGTTEINKLVSNPANPNMIYALTNNIGLRRIDLSTGTTWLGTSGLSLAGVASTNPSPLKRFEPLDDILAFENQPAQATETPAPQAQSTHSASQLLDMAFAPSDPSIAYLGTVGSGVYASADGGINWTQRGLTGETVRSIAVDPQTPGHVYVVTDTVKVSSDGGQSWSSIPLPGVKVNAVLFPSDGQDRLYAGTDQGLWVYQNNAWSSAGLTHKNITTLAVSPVNSNWIFAGTTSGAYMVIPDHGLEREFQETLGTAIQSIGFAAADPYQIYFGTVYRSTIHYTINH